VDGVMTRTPQRGRGRGRGNPGTMVMRVAMLLVHMEGMIVMLEGATLSAICSRFISCE